MAPEGRSPTGKSPRSAVGRGDSFEPPPRLLLRSALGALLATTAAYVPSPFPPFPRPDMLLIVMICTLLELQNRGERRDTAIELSRPSSYFDTEFRIQSLEPIRAALAKQHGVTRPGGGEISCCVPSFWRSLRGYEILSPSHLTSTMVRRDLRITQPAVVARVSTRSTRFAPWYGMDWGERGAFWVASI